jgi:RNA polymerase sigma-70 factor, ECF subfamily
MPVSGSGWPPVVDAGVDQPPELADSADAYEQASGCDRGLLRRLRAGDETALEALYDRYSGLVFTLALRIVGDRHLAEEVLQDTFWRCWVGAEQFDPRRGRPAGWLLGVARNRAIDVLRGRQHQARLHEREGLGRAEGLDHRTASSAHAGWPSMALQQPALSQPDVHEAVVLRDMLGHALGRLSTAQRQAIELAYYGGLTQVEIAQTLGVPLGTVKTRMRDGMERLRRVLRSHLATNDEAATP